MALFAGILGVMMLMHQTAGDLSQTMHESFGYVAITAAGVRIGCIFWDKLVVIYGMLMVSAGVFFNFSSVVLTYDWENGNHRCAPILGCSTGFVYFAMVLLIAMWIFIVTVTMRYFVSSTRTAPDTKAYELMSLTESEGAESTNNDLDESKV